MNKTKITASLLLAMTAVANMPIQAFATPQLESLTNQEKIQILDNEIVNSMEDIESLTKNIEAKESEIKTQYEDLIKTNEDYRLQKDNVSAKSNNAYKTNNIKMLDLILGSNSVTEFFQNLDLSTKIVKGTNRNLKLLDEKEDSLYEQQELLNKELSSLNNDKQKLEVEKTKLLDTKKTIETEIARIEAERLQNTKLQTAYDSLPIVDVPASEKAQAVLTEAYKYIGTPYVWGGTTPSGFDCSGFTGYVFNKVGITLPRVSEAQQNVGTKVSTSQIQPGDLVFFGNPAYHVGIYVGNGNYIHSPQTGDVVKIAKLSFDKVSSISRLL